jgi:3'-phosphoadenosine 5'-phosphosulfate (PAPS) 3'-phosphatase
MEAPVTPTKSSSLRPRGPLSPRRLVSPRSPRENFAVPMGSGRKHPGVSRLFPGGGAPGGMAQRFRTAQQLRSVSAIAAAFGLLTFLFWYGRHVATRPSLKVVGALTGKQLHFLTLAALESTVDAGKEIVDLRRQVVKDSVDAGVGKDKEAVTVADERSSAILAAMNVGDVAIITEETVETGAIPSLQTQADPVIFVDPLDATQEYSEDLAQYVSVQVCVTQCGHTLASILHFPFSKRTFLYRKGALDGEVQMHPNPDAALSAMKEAEGSIDLIRPSKLQCACKQPSLESIASGATIEKSDENTATSATALQKATDANLAAYKALSQDDKAKKFRAALPKSILESSNGALRLVITRSHLRNETRSETGTLSLSSAVKLLQQRMPQGKISITKAGGAGYKLAGVLTGEYDGYFHEGPIRQWDVCAGGALLNGAGGKVTDWTGEDHTFCLPPVAASEASSADASKSSNKKKKSGFAVKGLVAAKHHDVHSFLLRVVKGEFGMPE